VINANGLKNERMFLSCNIIADIICEGT